SSGEKLYTMAIQKQGLQLQMDRIEAALDNLVAQKEVGVDSAMRVSEMRSRQVISGLRMRLENQSVSEEDMLVATREVARLKGDVSALRVALNELKVRNELLQKENQTLTSPVTTTRNKVTVLSKDNTILKCKVQVASALKVSNRQVNGISISKKVEIATESRGRRVYQLQDLFSVADNTLAPKGSK